ncbi:MAG: hypothetical protein Q4E09_03560 [Eubacteriales bacterium]|nr:hypothetical protein [Eubacteriales bacterium]
MSDGSREVLGWLLGAAIVAVIAGLIMAADRYREDQDKIELAKGIMKALGYGLAAFLLPLTIIAIIAIGTNRKTF